MKKPQVQNAISLESFRILKSDFNVTEDIDGSILENLKIEFKFATGFSHEQSKRFVVKFIISIQHNDDSAFKLNVESQTTFTTQKDITEEFKSSGFANINAPAIAFPFLRSFIQTLCVNAGIPPIILPSFNFAEAVDSESK